jgi:hypothetical protein
MPHSYLPALFHPSELGRTVVLQTCPTKGAAWVTDGRINGYRLPWIWLADDNPYLVGQARCVCCGTFAPTRSHGLRIALTLLRRSSLFGYTGQTDEPTKDSTEKTSAVVDRGLTDRTVPLEDLTLVFQEGRVRGDLNSEHPPGSHITIALDHYW